MTVTNINVLKKNLANTIDNVIEHNEAITISTKNGNAVIMSEKDYNSMLETIYLSSQPCLVSKIKDGENEDLNSMKEYNPNEMF